MILKHICLTPPPRFCSSSHPAGGAAPLGPETGVETGGCRSGGPLRLWLRSLEASLQWASWAARQG